MILQPYLNKQIEELIILRTIVAPKVKENIQDALNKCGKRYSHCGYTKEHDKTGYGMWRPNKASDGPKIQ